MICKSRQGMHSIHHCGEEIDCLIDWVFNTEIAIDKHTHHITLRSPWQSMTVQYQWESRLYCIHAVMSGTLHSKLLFVISISHTLSLHDTAATLTQHSPTQYNSKPPVQLNLRLCSVAKSISPSQQRIRPDQS